MRFAQALIPGTLIRRFKRFLADVRLADGSEVTAHCANPGAMLGLKDPGLTVWVEPNDDPKRKLKFALRIVEAGGTLVGIDTSLPNRLVRAALMARQVPEFAAYGTVRPEVRYGQASRVDFLLSGTGLPDAYIEVKNVHLMRRSGLAEFPDSVTARGARHLDELAGVAGEGHRAVMLYVVQRGNCARLALPPISTRPMRGPSPGPGRPESRRWRLAAGWTRRRLSLIARSGSKSKETPDMKMSADLKRTGTEQRTPEGIRLHDPADFEGMRRAGRLAAECLDMLAEHVGSGVPTETLDDLAHEFILSHGATPAPLNYRGFPKSICASVNHVVCHGIPGAKIPGRSSSALHEGDIVNIDVTVILDGWHGDSSRMYVAGRIKPFAARLIRVTHESLMRGIAEVRPGATLGDIGHAIQSYAEGERCSVVRDFCGHGLGRVFHDAPNVLHYGRRGSGAELRPGMFFTIEPMINLGSPQTKTLSDGWTAITRDKSLSAQFEHSIGVTEDGCEIFTLSPKGLFFPKF